MRVQLQNVLMESIILLLSQPLPLGQNTLHYSNERK